MISIFIWHPSEQVFIGGAVLADVMKDKEEFWITKVFIFSFSKSPRNQKSKFLLRPNMRRKAWPALTSLVAAKNDLLPILLLISDWTIWVIWCQIRQFCWIDVRFAHLCHFDVRILTFGYLVSELPIWLFWCQICWPFDAKYLNLGCFDILIF